MHILATRVVGENKSGVLSTIFCVLRWNVGSANQIAELLISRVKNVISMKRSARRQKCMCYIRCMYAVLTWLTHIHG